MNEISTNLLRKYKDLPADYVLAIAALADKHENRRFLNDSDLHAQLLIECMIGNALADDEVRIYSGALKCFPDALNSTQSNSVRVLVDDYNEAKAIVEQLSGPQKNKITIFQVAKKQNNHFFTVGGRAFRYEMDHGKATALANFNEPTVVSNMNVRFDEMWAAAEATSQTEDAQAVLA